MSARYFIQFERPTIRRVLYGYHLLGDWDWAMLQIKFWPLYFSITRVSPNYGRPDHDIRDRYYD